MNHIKKELVLISMYTSLYLVIILSSFSQIKLIEWEN